MNKVWLDETDFELEKKASSKFLTMFDYEREKFLEKVSTSFCLSNWSPSMGKSTGQQKKKNKMFRQCVKIL